MKKETRIHLLYILGIFILCGIYLYDYFNIHTLPLRGDPSLSNGEDLTPFFMPHAYILKESIFEKHDFIPLWNPYFLSGTIGYLKPQVTVFTPLTLLLLIAPTVWAAIKWAVILHLALAGIGMYFLMLYFKESKQAAFIAASIFIFNGFILDRISTGNTNITFPYSYVPFIILFFLKAFQSKEWVRYSIIAGIFVSMLKHSGGPQLLLDSVSLIGYCFLFKTIGSNTPARIKKLIFIGLIMGIVFFGLTAIKVLPTNELMKIGQRKEGYSFETSVGSKLGLPEMDMGIVGFALMGLSLFSYKKKKFWFFLGIIILALLISSGSLFFKILWKFVPYMNKIKNVDNSLFIFALGASGLAALGATNLFSTIKKRFKLKESLVFIIVVVLILSNVFVFGIKPVKMADIEEQINSNNLFQNISKDKSIFRFHNYETNGVDWGVGHVSVPLGLQDVYGYDATYWILEYLPQYLSVANTDRAKLFGVLNMKYLSSMKPLNISGFKFVHKFEECSMELCQPDKSDGPYLYLNERFLPRALIAKNSILVVGNDQEALNVMYALMLDKNFDPSNTVVAKSKKSIKEYDQSLLEKFDVIFLASGPIDQSSLALLQNYINNGGTLIPNIVEGRTTINEPEILSMWANFLENSEKEFIDDDLLNYRDFDHLTISLNKKYDGFLVLSEKWSMFPGWTARINGKEKEILRANGVISAIPLEEERGDISFEYKPKLFIIGSRISLITLLLIIIYFLWYFYKKRK